MKKVVIYIGLFLLGGVIFSIFSPEKTVIKTEVQVVEREIEVEKVVEIEKIVEVVKEVVRSERKVTKRKTHPDGTIEEEEIYESNEQQLSRITEEIQQNYHEKLVAKEREFKEKYSKETSNKKRLTLLVGRNMDGDTGFAASYAFFGTVQLGVFGNLDSLNLGVGIRF